MRAFIFSGILLAATLSSISTSLATEGPWCIRAEYLTSTCSIPSFEMCRITALPLNGSCTPNPNYHGPAQTSQTVHRKKRAR